jgi:hypothetical protein
MCPSPGAGFVGSLALGYYDHGKLVYAGRRHPDDRRFRCGAGIAQIGGSTPCKADFPCTAARDAARGCGAGTRAGRRRRQAAVQPAAAGAPKGNRNRRWAGSGRNTCESCISIDVRLWQRQGRLRGHQCFSWSWKCGGEPSGNINVRTEQDAIVLVYRARSYGETEWKDIEQRVPITWTACHLGGRRPWFVCSVYKSGRYCGRRVAVLYGAGQLFACRGCYGLAYLSQQQSPRDRNLSRAQKIRMKLGGSPSLAEPFPPRPRGMHTRTYVRFKACAQASEATSWALTKLWLDRLRS